jgi:hypothetical protein
MRLYTLRTGDNQIQLFTFHLSKPIYFICYGEANLEKKENRKKGICINQPQSAQSAVKRKSAVKKESSAVKKKA